MTAKEKLAATRVKVGEIREIISDNEGCANTPQQMSVPGVEITVPKTESKLKRAGKLLGVCVGASVIGGGIGLAMRKMAGID